MAKITQKLLLAGWLVAVLGGFGVMNHYATQPGAQGQAPASVPADVQSITPAPGSFTDPANTTIPQIDLTLGKPSIFLFAHPDCPCTRASLQALRETVRPYADQAAVYIFFFDDPDQPGRWADTDLVRSVQRFTEATVQHDPGGRLAQVMGALTSGHVIAYDAQGTRQFSGGITPSRGHQGPNTGQEALRQLLADGQTHLEQARVYGCGLGNTPVPQ